ncbi:MAG: hypothetical protein FWG39_03230 [Alphaproteobacteria bacterium]|nr:hypothetical protein [Alphaproteobacteria bacterium]
MLKAKIIITALKILLWAAALGVGVAYLSMSLGGASLTYTSLDRFLDAIGACGPDGVCDIAAANGCFLCAYIEKLFAIIGAAAETFWTALIRNIWILLSLGFAIFLFKHSYEEIKKMNDAAAKLEDASEKKFDFKSWFDKVWRQALRVMIVGAILGVAGAGGTRVVRTVADVTITPVMYIGSTLAMAATGTMDSATCGVREGAEEGDILGPAMRPFMCVIANLNTVVLAGASGGFALMNYSWMGLGGGLWGWITGLGLVLVFMFVGLNIFFKILTVVFQLVFLIIFLPLIIAAWAYENEWKLVGDGFSNAIGMLAKCALRVIAITLQIMVFYAMVQFVATEYYPGPPGSNACYTVLLPAGILGNRPECKGQADDASMSVIEVFRHCETVATREVAGAREIVKTDFKSCFEMKKAEVTRKHPGAFDFMENGWEFFLMMMGLFIIYYYAVAKKIDGLFFGDAGKDGIFGSDMGDPFEYGKYVKEFGQGALQAPQKLLDRIEKAFT